MPIFLVTKPSSPLNSNDLEFLFLCGRSYQRFGSVSANALVDLTNAYHANSLGIRPLKKKLGEDLGISVSFSKWR